MLFVSLQTILKKGTNMPEHSKKDYIERFIKYRASEKVINKGKDLYNDGAVTLTYKSDASDAWHFSVQGSQKYSVIIKDLNKGDISIKCTCPFEWGTICKHSVASLLYVTDAGDDALPQAVQGEMLSNRVQRTALGFRIEDYKFIDSDVINKYSSYSILNNLKHSYKGIKIEDVKIEANQVLFEIRDDNFNVDVVYIRFRNDEVYISSATGSGTPRLNKLETFALMAIAESNTPDLLDVIFNKGLKDIEKETLIRYGFSEDDDFSVYFQHVFVPERGLDISSRPDQKGLIPIQSLNEVSFVNFVEKLNEETLVLDNIPKASDEFALGFVIDYGAADQDSFLDEYYFVEDSELEIFAITAKTSKDQRYLTSHFKRYDEFETLVKVTDNQQKIIDLIAKLKEDSSSEKRRFSLTKKLILLMAKGTVLFIPMKRMIAALEKQICYL